jgi:hypothetical protein
MSKKKPLPGKRYVWRDPNTGRMMGVVVADPVVKPKTVSVEKIREAVEAVSAERRTERAHRKRSA